MRWALDACYLLVAVLLTPLVIYRALTTGKYRQGWAERFGHVPALPSMPQGQRRIWVHAVSVGEMNAVRGLIEAWRATSPGTDFVISTTTDTGTARARQLFPELTVVRYPLDFSRSVRRALDRIRPDLIVLVELEVWFQFVREAVGRGIPVAVVNGRLSERSVRRFGRVLPLIRPMFSRLSWVGAQDEAYATRFRQMGVPPERVTVTGSVKWDTAEVADTIPGSDTLARAMGLDTERPLWVCGSTGGTYEESVILGAYARLLERFSGCQLVLVPRKPERFDEVAEAIRRAGYTCVRRSASPDGTERAPAEGAVHLGDTMGELRKFYALADVVFVGRTIEPMGGSDMMEVAGLGKPIVVGPHTGNFADAMQQLLAGGAVRVVATGTDLSHSSEALGRAVEAILGDRDQARELGARAREVLLRNRGATQRTLARLMEMAGTPPTSARARS